MPETQAVGSSGECKLGSRIFRRGYCPKPEDVTCSYIHGQARDSRLENCVTVVQMLTRLPYRELIVGRGN